MTKLIGTIREYAKRLITTDSDVWKVIDYEDLIYLFIYGLLSDNVIKRDSVTCYWIVRW
jgi:hypothetical protein